MAFKPVFTITAGLLAHGKQIAAFATPIPRSRSKAIRSPSSKCARLRRAVSSPATRSRPRRVANYFAGLRFELVMRDGRAHHIFSIDEFYWEDAPRYCAAPEKVRQQNGDLTSWVEYSAAGIRATLERVWTRAQKLTAHGGKGSSCYVRNRSSCSISCASTRR